MADEHRQMIDELFLEIRATILYRHLPAEGMTGVSCCHLTFNTQSTAMSAIHAPDQQTALSAELATIILFFLLRVLQEEGGIRFGSTVRAAQEQLDHSPRVLNEVDYLWTSFQNICQYCRCRDPRRTTAIESSCHWTSSVTELSCTSTNLVPHTSLNLRLTLRLTTQCYI